MRIKINDYGIPSSMIAGTTINGDMHLVCNHVAPKSVTTEEAFMFILSRSPDMLTVYWHGGRTTRESFQGVGPLRKFKQYYHTYMLENIRSHEAVRRDTSIVSVAHSVNVTNLHAKIGATIKTKIERIRHLHITDIQKKLSMIVKTMDSLYTTQLFPDSDVSGSRDPDAYAVYVSATAENMAVHDTITEKNAEWTLFELKHLFRLTINDYFQSILEGTPLQSHFLFHAMLLRLDSLLSRLVD